MSILELLGLPQPFGVTLLGLGLLLTLCPYMGGADFGLFKVPTFSGDLQRRLRVLGPIALLAAVVMHVPLSTQPGVPGSTTVEGPVTPEASPNVDSGPALRQTGSNSCRIVILEPTDNIFGCNRSLRVWIDKFEFIFQPCTRSSAMFVMKAYDPGFYEVRLQSTWPLDTPGLSGAHFHEGHIALDEHEYYVITPHERPAFPYAMFDIPISSRGLTRNEYERLLALYNLGEPACESYGAGVQLVDEVSSSWMGGLVLVGLVTATALAIGWRYRRRILARKEQTF